MFLQRGVQRSENGKGVIPHRIEQELRQWTLKYDCGKVNMIKFLSSFCYTPGLKINVTKYMKN